MAKVGDRLTSPESGWQRINDTDSRIKYEGTWRIDSYSGFWDGNIHSTIEKGGGYFIFYLYGDKFRIIDHIYTNRSSKNNVYIDDEYVGSYSGNGGSDTTQIIQYEKLNLDFGVHKIKIEQDSSTVSINQLLCVDCIDIGSNARLLTDEEYNKKLIYINSKYYTIESNSLVEVIDVINKEYIIDRGCTLETINNNLDILPNKFSIISAVGNNKIKGIKSNKELIVASNNFSSKIAEHIDYFKAVYEKNTNSSIKLAFSIDNGVTWKGNNFEELSIEIPLKPFSELTEDEKIKWENAKNSIFNNGINVEDLETLDFNTIDFEYIRFAYVLSVTSVDDICNTSKLKWQFDAKGSMQLMDSSEIGIEVLSNSIKVTPKISSDMIKINFSNGSTIDMTNQDNIKSLIENMSEENINRLKEKLGI